MVNKFLLSAALGLILAAVYPLSQARAESAAAELFLATSSGQGASIGQVSFNDVPGGGVDIVTDFHDLPGGVHGFHIHENGTCAPAENNGSMTPAQGAGGHYDPDRTGRHLGPDGGGHKGDLPRLTVETDGTARHNMRVNNLTVAEIKNRAIIVHAGGDNYSDTPEELGGGGARLACGVIR